MMPLKHKDALSVKLDTVRNSHEDTSHERPLTRRDCERIERPCPYVSCKYNMFLEVTRLGGITFFHGTEDFFGRDGKPVMSPMASCSLDIIDREGALTLEEVGELMGLTRERIRQIAEAALGKVKRADVHGVLKRELEP